MARDFGEVLQQAMEFYVAGQLVEARALLLDIVRADPRLEAGWMFLSYTLEEPAQKADCLRKVLAINPENAEAKSALERLPGGPKTESVESAPAPRAAVPTAPPITPAPVAASAAPPTSDSPSDAPTVVHSSPFTVDIDHANDDLSAIPEIGDPALGVQAVQPSQTHVNPFPQQPASAVKKPRTAPLADEKKPAVEASSPQAVAAPFHAAAADAPTAAKAPTPPVRKTGQLAQTSAQPSASPDLKPPAAQGTDAPKKRRSTGCTCLIIGIILTLVVAAVGTGLWMTGNLPAIFNTGAASVASVTPDRPVDTPTPFILPPRATETPTPTLTRTLTITYTPTITPSPTLAPPDATVQADMARLIKEVEDIRGLKMEGSVPAYIVDRDQAEAILQADLDRIGYDETIKIEAKALAVLGFIKPTYDLAKYATSRQADGVLGFYMPYNRTMYIIGNRFAGMERWTFSHEFDHALVHSIYPDSMASRGDPLCANDSQRCEAIRALVEGDAMLVETMWRDQYATAYDERDIALSPYQLLMPPEQNTPAYMYPSMLFTYLGGETFVYTLWKQGNWALVNKVYEKLPDSTEQILHPEKFLAGEKPVAMKVPELGNVVGEGWSLIKSDSLGEFKSYLLLAFGADNPAQLSTDTAAEAVTGWGGDHYLVFESAAGEQLLLAAEWAWDTDADATQFLAAMEDYLDKRFRGGAVQAAAGKCWSMNDTSTCVYRSGKSILWLTGPDMGIFNAVRLAYGNY
ncbi:MAG: hypothetical protein WBM17_05650 [Anaerolineales bacterium]